MPPMPKPTDSDDDRLDEQPDQPDHPPAAARRRTKCPHGISDALRERLSAGRDPRLDEWLWSDD
jgi:hypothetical protein